jgi:HAD superfamily hydrolase (TIGR01509 family)
VSALPDEPVLPAAVLWDMDGTLVDTEPYWIEAEHEVVAEHGGVWTEDDAHALVGNPLLVSAEYLRTRGGVDLPAEEIVELLIDRVVDDVRRRVPWRPGVRELLEEMAGQGIPCALVTMSYARLARAVTDQLPPGTFAAIVTGDEVRHGKPHPEPYLTAAARLGVRPEECLAIEDSPTGAASAAAAGTAVVAVPCVVPVPPGPGHLVVPTLRGRRTAELYALATEHGRREPSSRIVSGRSSTVRD